MNKLSLFLILFSLCFSSFGQTICYVDINSATPTSPFTSWATAATNPIQLNSVLTNGNTVLIRTGVYTLTQEWTVASARTNITVSSESNNPNTVFFRTSTNTFVWLSATNNTKIYGITFEEWNNFGPLAMIRTVTVSRSTISNCVFRNNNTNILANSSTALTFVFTTNSLIQNTTFQNNQSRGLNTTFAPFRANLNATIQNTTFLENKSYECFSMVEFFQAIDTLSFNTSYISNYAENVSSNYGSFRTPFRFNVLVNSVFRDNVLTNSSGSGQYGQGISVETSSGRSFTLFNCVFERNRYVSSSTSRNLSFVRSYSTNLIGNLLFTNNIVQSRVIIDIPFLLDISALQVPFIPATISNLVFANNTLINGSVFYFALENRNYANVKIINNIGIFTNVAIVPALTYIGAPNIIMSNWEISGNNMYYTNLAINISMMDKIPSVANTIIQNLLIINNNRWDTNGTPGTVNSFGLYNNRLEISGSVLVKVYNSILYSNMVRHLNADHSFMIGNSANNGIPSNSFYSTFVPNYTGTNSVLGILTNQIPAFIDANNGDYRPAPNSPQVESGTINTSAFMLTLFTNSVDLSNNPRIIGRTIDVGPYEYFDSPVTLPYNDWKPLYTALDKHFATKTFVVNQLNISGIPTSLVGLVRGDIWWDGVNMRVITNQ